MEYFIIKLLSVIFWYTSILVFMQPIQKSNKLPFLLMFTIQSLPIQLAFSFSAASKKILCFSWSHKHKINNLNILQLCICNQFVYKMLTNFYFHFSHSDDPFHYLLYLFTYLAVRTCYGSWPQLICDAIHHACCDVRGRALASHTGVRRFDSRGGDCLLQKIGFLLQTFYWSPSK